MHPAKLTLLTQTSPLALHHRIMPRLQCLRRLQVPCGQAMTQWRVEAVLTVVVIFASAPVTTAISLAGSFPCAAARAEHQRVRLVWRLSLRATFQGGSRHSGTRCYQRLWRPARGARSHQTADGDQWA